MTALPSGRFCQTYGPREPMSAQQFQQDYPALPATVAESNAEPVDYGSTDETFLGGDALPAAEPSSAPTEKPTPEPSDEQEPTESTSAAPEKSPSASSGAEASVPSATPPPAEPPQSGGLADSGGPDWWPVPVGLALLVGGAGLLLWRRRHV